MWWHINTGMENIFELVCDSVYDCLKKSYVIPLVNLQVQVHDNGERGTTSFMSALTNNKHVDFRMSSCPFFSWPD